MEKSIEQLSDSKKEEILAEIAKLNARIITLDEDHTTNTIGEIEFQAQRGEITKRLDEIYTSHPELKEGEGNK